MNGVRLLMCTHLSRVFEAQIKTTCKTDNRTVQLSLSPVFETQDSLQSNIQ